MLQDQCISVTDLRKNTKKCIGDLKKFEKYIFINNKPVAVLIDIHAYENFCANIRLKELPITEVDPKIKQMSQETRKMNSSEFINI